MPIEEKTGNRTSSLSAPRTRRHSLASLKLLPIVSNIAASPIDRRSSNSRHLIPFRFDYAVNSTTQFSYPSFRP